MAVERCYYEVLGVERAANGDEIKRSYRRLAMKWHPDRNPGDAQAEAEFKACAEAYEVLGDPERRARYDQHSSAVAGNALDAALRADTTSKNRWRSSWPTC